MHPKGRRFCLGAVLLMSMRGPLGKGIGVFYPNRNTENSLPAGHKIHGHPCFLAKLLHKLWLKPMCPCAGWSMRQPPGAMWPPLPKAALAATQSLIDFAAAWGSCGGSAASSPGSLTTFCIVNVSDMSSVPRTDFLNVAVEIKYILFIYS